MPTCQTPRNPRPPGPWVRTCSAATTAAKATCRPAQIKWPGSGLMPNAPNKVVVDSGPLIALFDAGDGYHRRALEFVRQSRAKLISSMAVVTEAMYVLDP